MVDDELEDWGIDDASSSMEEKKVTRVRTGQFYEDFKRLCKWSFRYICYFVLMYIFYSIFSIWVFLGALIFSIPSFFFIKKIYIPKGKKLVEFDSEKGYMNLVFIPSHKYKEFTVEGKFSPFNSFYFVKKVDIEGKKITGYWFRDYDDMEFLCNVGAYNDLVSFMRKWFDKYAKATVNSEVVGIKRSGQFIRMFDNEINKIPKDIDEIIKLTNEED